MKKGLATIWAVIITVVVMAALGAGGWYYISGQQKAQKSDYDKQVTDLQKQIDALKEASQASKQTSSNDSDEAASSSSSNSNSKTSSDPYLYTNTTYGFSLQFNSKWQGYKMMPATVSGSTATYYVTLPTTDSFWQKATSTSYAGTVSLFALSVYTKAQWATASAEEVNMSTKIGDAGDWVVAYSMAQDYPQEASILAALQDYKNVIATFKAL